MINTDPTGTRTSSPGATIEADPEVPRIIITREFTATVEQLMRAHLDPDIYAQWSGPEQLTTTIDHWDARTGGSWAFTQTDGEGTYSFHGCFHEVGTDRIVQTFTYDDQPDGVALETLTFTDLGNGRVRLDAQSLVDSFAGRDAWLQSGMEVGVNEGYAKLDALLAAGAGAA